jgi:hypothetical protein
VNFPIWFNTLGGNSPPVSDLMWTIIIALSNWQVCSSNSVQLFLFCLIVWKNWLRLVLVVDSVEIHLHMFQERLSCVGHGLQERALKATGKNMQSICSDIHTCCNIVQLDLSDTGLGGHLGGETWVEMSVCYIFFPGNFIVIGYCSSPAASKMRCSVHIFRYSIEGS